MKFSLATKRRMMQIFDEAGHAIPVTVVQMPAQMADNFAPGEAVRVSGTSKGKGFQGVVKRHGFRGGPRSHGQKHTERSPGSLGTAGMQRVIKGMRMAGRMGGNRVTVRGLRVIAVDPDAREVAILGAIPGRRGSRLEIRSEE